MVYSLVAFLLSFSGSLAAMLVGWLLRQWTKQKSAPSRKEKHS